MTHDLIIRNGTVLDGTGAASIQADVAVDGDRVVAIGNLADAEAREVIDARGLTVSPGFVDLHTHLDAQVGWDPYMTSSSWHGVTTVLMGNCGVTFAPVAEDGREYLAEMMESVEDIPRDAILEGMPWDWETYPEYLDSVQRMRPALNVVGMVGHCAVRYHVMGERSLSDEAPTPAELARMRDIAAESIAGGAVGYSTSRILIHTVPDGRCVPGTYSSIDEYSAIVAGMNEAGGGIFQSVNDFATKAAHEFQLLRTMAEQAGDVLFSGGVGDDPAKANAATAGWDQFLNDTNANVGRITSAAMTRPGGMLVGLRQIAPVRGGAWSSVIKLPTLEARVRALKDAATRAELVAEGMQRGLWYDPSYIFPLGNDEFPDYSMENAKSVADYAAELGVHPVEFVIDRLIESEGRELFNMWFFNRNAEALGEFLQLEGVCPGLGDAGAHAGQICDADSPTHYLSYWQRERNKVSLAHAIHQLTAKPAAVLGLIDRGTLRVGAYADINVFDPAKVQAHYPDYVNDFPNDKGRFLVRAQGYAATIVNGKVVTQQGAHTGARPGVVIREFARG